MKQSEIRVGSVYEGGKVKMQRRKVLAMMDKPDWWGYNFPPILKHWVRYKVVLGPHQGEISSCSLKYFANRWVKKLVSQAGFKGVLS